MSPCTMPQAESTVSKRRRSPWTRCCTLTPWTYLCSFQGGMEDPKAKQQMLHKVLAIKEQHFGKRHWQVVITLNDLANAHLMLGDHRTQKELLARALRIFKEHFGEEHFTVARTLVNLGAAYQELGTTRRPKTSSSEP